MMSFVWHSDGVLSLRIDCTYYISFQNTLLGYIQYVVEKR
jgi:hypothetical protein